MILGQNLKFLETFGIVTRYQEMMFDTGWKHYNNNNNNNNELKFLPRSFYKNIQLRLTIRY